MRWLCILVLLFQFSAYAESNTPPVDTDGTVTFEYRGTGHERSVELVGDFRQKSQRSVAWDDHGEPFERTDAGTFVLRHRFENDARIEYRLVVDGIPQVDPTNPRHFDGGIVGEVSELQMPGYQSPPELTTRDNVPKGRTEAWTDTWATPNVRIYLPPGYTNARRYPVLYTADGTAWALALQLPTILDNLIADGAIEPIIAVMIDAAEDRSAWYQFNPAYIAYLGRVVQTVDQRYATRAIPSARVHAGTSAGAKIALYAAFERPDLFSNAAILSPTLMGAFSDFEPWFTGRKRLAPGSRLFLSAGNYEGKIAEDAEALKRFLEQHHASVTLIKTHQGHSFGHWRSLLPAMLKHFFGQKTR